MPGAVTGETRYLGVVAEEVTTLPHGEAHRQHDGVPHIGIHLAVQVEHGSLEAIVFRVGVGDVVEVVLGLVEHQLRVVVATEGKLEIVECRPGVSATELYAHVERGAFLGVDVESVGILMLAKHLAGLGEVGWRGTLTIEIVHVGQSLVHGIAVASGEEVRAVSRVIGKALARHTIPSCAWNGDCLMEIGSVVAPHLTTEILPVFLGFSFPFTLATARIAISAFRVRVADLRRIKFLHAELQTRIALMVFSRGLPIRVECGATIQALVLHEEGHIERLAHACR